MAGLDFKAPVTREQEDEADIARNMRTGVILFVVYVLMYGGFIGLAAFSPKAMATPVLAGANLAVVYGFGLILAALVLALLYMRLCRASK